MKKILILSGLVFFLLACSPDDDILLNELNANRQIWESNQIENYFLKSSSLVASNNFFSCIFAYFSTFLTSISSLPAQLRSGKVEAICVHHLVPGCYEVVEKFLLGVRTSIDFR